VEIEFERPCAIGLLDEMVAGPRCGRWIDVLSFVHIVLDPYTSGLRRNPSIITCATWIPSEP